MKCFRILFFIFALCILVTTGHEDRHKKYESRQHSGSNIKKIAYRVGNQHCELVCTNNGTSSTSADIEIKYNGDASLLAYVKDSVHVAIIFDYWSNITLILNGKTGKAVIEDRANQKYYLVEKNSLTEKLLPLTPTSDFNSFFKNLTSLKEVVKISEQYGKTIEDLEGVYNLVKSDLSELRIELAKDNFISTDMKFLTLLNTTLRFIFKGQGSFNIHKRIIWFEKVNLAFAEIFESSDGKMESLSNLTLNLSAVYDTSSGAEALLNLLSQIGEHVDLAKLFRHLLSNPRRLLDILGNLSGGSNEGIDGILTVIVNIVKALTGQPSFHDIFTAIINFKPFSEGNSDSLSKVVDEALDLIQSQNKRFNNSAAFRGIIRVLKAVNDHNFVYNNVNISEIITLLISRDPVTMISTIIEVFTRFLKTHGFPARYIRMFIEVLNSSDGLNFFSRLFPGVSQSRIQEILKRVVHALRNCRSVSEIVSTLSHVPVVGNIFETIFSNLGGAFDISGIIDSGPVTGIVHNLTENTPFSGIVGSLTNGSSAIGGIIHQLTGGFSEELFGGSGSTEEPEEERNQKFHEDKHLEHQHNRKLNAHSRHQFHDKKVSVHKEGPQERKHVP